MKQSSLASFLTPGKRKQPIEFIDIDDETPSKKTKLKSQSTIDGGARVKGPMDLTNLPPIFKLEEMFEDIVDNSALSGIETLLEKLDGRKLRVATMCSGTESPLLALSMISPIIEKKFGKPLEIDHVFSCEIEPFKQAYIERNFSPPILFRDVCELGNDSATTAYGAKVHVPGDVDILIAGTSCVDFSNLNNNKQQIDGEGESGATFKGMLSWVDRHRPTIVILENVLSAPWEKSVCPKFRRIGYDAEWHKLDTKCYYIPHTRQRGYMCAVDARANKGKDRQKLKSVPTQWKDLVKRLERPASSPIEAFLLPDDDPRIVKTRASMMDIDRKASTIDWARCEVRHRNARFAEEIGEKRPLTMWAEGGGCTLPDFAWNDWAITQPERVLDLLDISILRYAVKGIDAMHKTIVWNLSQNVDRIGYPKGGLSPCMTPTMIPYISNRGGPMTGYEALGMQGLPVDRLLLTRESEDNCMDLAGNAMSTTVVGSCVMAALVLSASQLRYRECAATKTVVNEQSGFSGIEKLVKDELDLGKVVKMSGAQLLDHADRSRRLCQCEGRTAMTNRPIVQCQDCGFTACSKCYGRPEHNYKRIGDEVDLHDFKLDRLDPQTFAKEFKSAVPMRLKFDRIRVDPMPGVIESLWPHYKAGVEKAFGSELRFRQLKRQEVWSAIWDSNYASLELILDPHQPEWRLFVKADPVLASDSPVRSLFAQPVARLSFQNNDQPLLTGEWELCYPTCNTFEVKLTGGQVEDLVPSWEMSLGILLREYATKRVWRYLDIEVPDEAKEHLDLAIDGRYYLHDKCGSANNSLHKHQSKSLYFFLDPKRCTTAEADYFVFSPSQRRYAYGESRPIAARFDTKWRQFGQARTDANIIQERTANCTVDGSWRKLPELVLQASHTRNAEVLMPATGLSIDIDHKACHSADALLVCKLPLKDAESIWTTSWTEVDHIHERQIFGALSWLTERLRGIDVLDTWLEIPSIQEAHCERCAPKAPEVIFGDVFTASKKPGSMPRSRIVGVEDIGEAGRFEQGLKNRPRPFVTQLRCINDIAEVRIGLNVASLIHQALALLPKGPNIARCYWRLDTNYVERHRLILPSFKKALENSSNRDELEARQPPHFLLPLRKEQLRSLTWMLRQESAEAEPFVEQEIVEALLTPLNWRAEARATRAVDIKGGVLADEVGYGKTAITLGLIDSSPDGQSIPNDESGFISVKATLIVVPAHLIKQWPMEIRKFLGNDIKCLTLESVSSLKRTTIAEIQAADIVCIAGNMLKSQKYLALLGALAGGVKIPDSGGRYFDQKHAEAIRGLKQTVEDLKQGRVAKAWQDIREGRPEDMARRQKAFIQKKRMKGRAFREHKAQERALTKKPRIEYTDSSDEEDSVHKQRFAVVINKKVKSAPPISPVNAWKKTPGSSDSSTTRNLDLSDSDDKENDDPEADMRDEIYAERGSDINETIKSDPWGLGSSNVQSNFKRFKSPVLEMFKFNRFVIDEYTYLVGLLHKMTMNMRSDRRWILSGTPPIEDFAAIKTISVFLGIELGINDIPPNLKAQRSWFNAFTAVEKFHSFRESRSYAWHRTRHQQADRFLKQFMRQNKAEIDEIPSQELHHDVILPAAERAIYLELLHHLQALDMNIKKSKKGLSDRDIRIAQSFGESQSAEEALLKRCAHFDYGAHDAEDNAIYECDRLVAKRTEQLRECELHLHQILWELYSEEHKDTQAKKSESAGLFAEDSIFRAWLKHMKLNGTSDADASARVARMISQIEAAIKVSTKKKPELSEYETDAARRARLRYNKPKKSIIAPAVKTPVVLSDAEQDESEDEITKPQRKQAKQAKAIISIDDDEVFDDAEKLIPRQPDWVDEAKRLFKDKAHQLKRIEKELVGRVKSLRFFEVVRDVQRLNSTTIRPEDKPKLDFTCPGKDCAHAGRKLQLKDVCVFSTCGHSGCYECLHQSSLDQKCPAPGCYQPGILYVIVRSTSLGEEEDIKNELVAGKHWGTKIEQICDLIKNKIPKTDKIILFTQFKDLTDTVDMALTDKGIARLRITGSASAKSKALLAFQSESSKERVLLLNVDDESASGANLTIANHVIFVSPLLCESFSQYSAQETQAIGRVRRYGQKKMVTVHRFLTRDTVDTEIYQKRELEKVKFDKEDLEDW